MLQVKIHEEVIFKIFKLFIQNEIGRKVKQSFERKIFISKFSKFGVCVKFKN